MILLADQNGQIDSAYHTLVKHIKSKYPIVMVSYSDNFVFNEELLSLKAREFIVIDFIEMGWNYDYSAHTIENYYKRFKGEEWKKYHDWAASSQPLLCFKRELDKETAKIPGYFPIEYPCVIPEWVPDTKAGFNTRTVNVFQYWGRSNECRIRIHGEIWNHAFKKGFQPCDNIYYIQKYLSEEQGEKWITLWIPHWARLDINQLMPFNNLSKLSLSWPGAGFKCFRNGEAPVNSVMVMHKNNFAWTHDWNETNCILVKPGKEIEGIEQALQREDLYDIYLAGMENVNKYRLENYLPYLENIINNA